MSKKYRYKPSGTQLPKVEFSQHWQNDLPDPILEHNAILAQMTFSTLPEPKPKQD